MADELRKAVELRQDRAKIWEQAKAIVDKAEAESRDLTDEENASFQKMEADIKSLGERAERIERLHDVEVDNEERQKVIAGQQDAGPGKTLSEEQVREDETSYRDAFRLWAVGGDAALEPEERQTLGIARIEQGDMEARLAKYTGLNTVSLRFPSVPENPDQRRVWNKDTMRWEFRTRREQRAQSSGTDTTGGFSVPNEAMRALEDALLAFGGMRQARTTVLRTATGATLPIPTVNDTTNVGVLLAENVQETTTTDLTFAQVTLSAYKYSSDLVLASFEFLQDTSIDADIYIARKLGERIGRITNTHFTTGTGASRPTGVENGTAGVTAASVSAITADELIDLEHSVDPSYRVNGEFMFADGTLQAFRKLKTTDLQYIWVPGLAARQADRVLGRNYIINQDCDAIAAAAHSVIFGDFSKYWIRDVMDIRVLRLVERFADYAQVGFLGFSRHDGKIVDAGGAPLKYLRHPAS